MHRVGDTCECDASLALGFWAQLQGETACSVCAPGWHGALCSTLPSTSSSSDASELSGASAGATSVSEQQPVGITPLLLAEIAAVCAVLVIGALGVVVAVWRHCGRTREQRTLLPGAPSRIALCCQTICPQRRTDAAEI